jgi:predicted membrane protein (TIGR00267 family)
MSSGWKLFNKNIAYLRTSGVTRLARRYFVMNSFDGALTTIGLLMGAFVGGLRDPHSILAVSVSTAIAIGLSGAWGTFLTEQAERKRELKEWEHLLLRKLDRTDLASAQRFAAYYVAAIDGLSPLVASLLIVSPFALLNATNAELLYAYSFALGAIVLFSLGVFLGRLSKENTLLLGLKMLLAGIAASAISFLLLNGKMS